VRAADLIAAGGVLLRPPCRTFEEAVGALVDALIANRRMPGPMREAAIRAVCDREAVASTAIVEIGVAVPHARLDGIIGVMAALAVSPNGVYQAMTGVPISIVALVFSAPDMIGEHLNSLAGVSMLLQSAALRRALEQAPDLPTALRALRGGNGHST
jgi:mannitol/fructose-specific phosphotransferase system IIA component (Ntr-type)